MIRLTCTQCKSVLEMDDAFAGGVCRCQHCGTIQTVPSHLKGSAVGAGTGQKSIYQGAAQAGNSARQSATGLYELADAVASSGLSRSSLSKPAARAPVAAPAAPPAGHTLLLIGLAAGAVIAILAGVVVWLIVAKSPPSQATLGPSSPVAPSNPVPEVVDTGPKPPVAPQAPSGPHFLTVPIDAGKIVYVIDRGESGKQTLDTVKLALFNSIRSLGPSREFAVVFWSKRGDDLKQWSFPEQGMARVTPQQAESVSEKFADVQAFGSPDVSAAVKQAIALKPDAVFLVTAKGINLDDGFTQAVRSARKNSDAKIYTIDLADGAGRKFLEPIAKESGGSYTAFSQFEVKPD